MKFLRGTWHMTRRDFFAGVALGATRLRFDGTAPALLVASRAPIRIGAINVFSGVSAYVGETNLSGLTLYFDEIGWTIAGRKVEILKEDEQFDPQLGLEKAKKLVEAEHVDMLVGPGFSNVAFAIQNYVKQTGTFQIISVAGNDALTWQHLPTVFRTSITSWQGSHAMGDWFYDHVAKEVVCCAMDYTAGHEVIGDFKSAFAAKGGKVVEEIYTPLGTTDFSVYLAQVRASGAPASYSFYVGTDGIRWVQQYSDFGLKDKVRLTGYGSLFDDQTFAALGKAALGGLSPCIYTATLDNPANQRFVAQYLAARKVLPIPYAEYGYTTAKVIDETLKATGGDTDKAKMAAAMVKVAFDAPRGPFRFDPVSHNPVQNIYITEVRQQAGRLVNAVVATVEDVRDPGRRTG